MEGQFVVYALRSAKKRYIGCTSDMVSRLDAHNKGLSTFTKKYGPWTLEWTSRPLSHLDALALEKKMKKQKGGDGLQKLMDSWKGS